MLITGIDIGGSHITAGMVDDSGYVLNEAHIVRSRVDSHAAANTILEGWCEAIRRTWAAYGVSSAPLAFAMPGPFDYKHGICLIKGFGKYEALYKVDIRAALAARLQLPPALILFRNDAAAFLAGEVSAGAAKGYAHAIGITLGTGMGTAKSHHGITTDAELSFSVQVDGATIEEYISTRGLLRSYYNATGRQLTDAKALAALFTTDANAREAFYIFAKQLAYLLSVFIKAEQPEIVVMGGNITEAWHLFMPTVSELLSVAPLPPPPIVKAAIGEHAAIIGAATMFALP